MGSNIVRFARVIHVISAFWILILGVIILIDVFGRTLFSAPLLGATEIIKNSVVSITFLQLPLAIYSGSMLRTSIIADAVGPTTQKVLRTITGLLGTLFFVFLIISAWDHMIDAWRIGEYEGEGALRVPTYPVRTLMIGTAIFSALAYLMMIYFDWTDQLDEDAAYPDAHQFSMTTSPIAGSSSAEDR